jgi:NDP-hexose-3,4-dehydratase
MQARQDPTEDISFRPGHTLIPSAAPVYDEDDRAALVSAAMEMRVGAGELAERFEQRFADMTGRKRAILVNSGSSANLLAMTALTSPLLRNRRLRPGDEVITAALSFPTTVNAILQNCLVPVFYRS